MRVLKFRIWDKENKQIHYCDAMGIMDNGIWFENSNFDTDNHNDDEAADVMQFTGLHDKNGKEIYEGDIVRQEKWVSVGKYAPSIGVIKYKSVGFTCECIGDWHGSNADLNGNAEIIGNIYENTELL